MHSRRSRRVKIIATLGPASADRETVAALFDAGADVFRINMSHASHDAMRERVAMIRALEEETDRPIGSSGRPAGTEAEGRPVRRRRRRNCTRATSSRSTPTPRPATRRRVQLPHPEILSSLAPGHRVLVDDGKVLLRVVEPRARPRRRPSSRSPAASPTRRASACPTRPSRPRR